MKIALLTDTHFGVRKDSITYLNKQVEFFDKLFFPILKNRGIKQVIHLGDLVDRQRGISFVISQAMRTSFLKPLKDMGIEMTAIVGNHDVPYHKLTTTVNVYRELIKDRFPIRVCEKPHTVMFDGRMTLLLPWICDDNRDSALECIAKSGATVVLGHLELVGFKHAHNTPESEHGLDPNPFSRFEKVMTGHFHHRSSKGNIFYLGSPYEMTWADAGDPKGFHIWDTETNELEFIVNPYTMFQTITWDNTPSYDSLDFDGKIIKVIVKNVSNRQKLDDYIRMLEGRAEQVIVDERIPLTVAAPVDLQKANSFQDVMKYTVDELETDVDKTKLFTLLSDLYIEVSE